MITNKEMISPVTEELVVNNEADMTSWGKKIRADRSILSDGHITAISTSRRTGKTRFIIDSLKVLTEESAVDYINIYVVTRTQKMLYLHLLDEKLPGWKDLPVMIGIITPDDETTWHSLQHGRIVNFVDEAYYQPEKVIEAIVSYGRYNAPTWILVSTGLYAKSSKKNPFKACFELPYIRTYDVKMSEGYFKKMNFGSAPLEAGDFVIKGYND